jgi:hypothetical protein
MKSVFVFSWFCAAFDTILSVLSLTSCVYAILLLVSFAKNFASGLRSKRLLSNYKGLSLPTHFPAFLSDRFRESFRQTKSS